MAGLNASQLTLAYDNVRIIENLSLTITTGQITALVGPNGCGKSTLLRGLSRILKPKHGSVVLNAQDIWQVPSKELAKQLGILPQNPVAPEGLTVHELIAQGRYPHQSWWQQWSSQDEHITLDAMRITGMIAFADRPVDTLSGGQRQRAWIAMTLAQDSDFILLDEPTTFLDIGHQIEILELVERLSRERGKTIVMVLHDLNQAARYADRMVVLNDGQIVADGAPKQVLTSELLTTVFGVQANIILDPATCAPVCLPYATTSRIETEYAKQQ